MHLRLRWSGLLWASVMTFALACGGPQETSSEGQEDPATDPATEGSATEGSTAEDPITVDGLTPERQAQAGECAVDADCVPAGCCHASACVPSDQAPDCHETMCTLECRENTLDCGGGCRCVETRCVAELGSLVD